MIIDLYIYTQNYLAGPNVDGEVNKLRVFPDKILNGLQLQIVWGLLFQNQPGDETKTLNN